MKYVVVTRQGLLRQTKTAVMPTGKTEKSSKATVWNSRKDAQVVADSYSRPGGRGRPSLATVVPLAI